MGYQNGFQVIGSRFFLVSNGINIENASVAIVDQEGNIMRLKDRKTQPVVYSNEMQARCDVEVAERVLTLNVKIINIRGINI